MKERLKRELNKTYLILDSMDVQYEETYEIEMLLKNELPSILPLHVLRLNGNLQLFYEISSKQTLMDCAERSKLSAATIRSLFASLNELIRETKNFLLDMDCVLLDLEHIYTQGGRFYFCYCPWEKREILSAFRALLEEILEKLDYHDTQGVELAYHLYQSACKGNFCISDILKEHEEVKEIHEEEEFKQYFEKMEEESPLEGAAEKEEKKQKGILGWILKFFLKKQEGIESPQESEVQSGIDTKLLPKEEWSVPATYEQEANTMLLGSMPLGGWKLRPVFPGFPEFDVAGDNFLIGKKRDCVDGYLDRDTISRIHSRLFVKNNGLYISDANSTNGTYVNGESIPPGKDVEICAGDRILFADVEYECYNSL